MGAYIKGIGTTRLEIEGIDSLHPANDVLNTRTASKRGTFLAAAAITRGAVTLLNVNPLHLTAVISKLESTGAQLMIAENSITIKCPKEHLACRYYNIRISGLLPTDMQGTVDGA